MNKTMPSAEKQQNNETKGVKMLLGDPKKATLKLAVPMIIAMSAHTIYNVVDAFWVSGLGADALAGVGFIFPFMFMIMAIATGIGVGSGSAISRRIGGNDKEGADKVASNTIAIMVITSIVLTALLLIFSENILIITGSGEVTALALTYGNIIFGGTIIIFFTNIANAILRAEGDAKRAMYIMLLGAFLNIVFDPIFIYTLDFGVAGAAWATMLSYSISSILMMYWLFLKQNTFVSFSFKGFRFEKAVLHDIFKVGIPSSVQQLTMSISIFILNMIITFVYSTDGVAVYTIGWRIATIAILPMLGIATAVTSVTGAAFGARSYEKLKTSFLYAVKFGLFIEIIIAVVIFIAAPVLTIAFSSGHETAHIADDLLYFIQVSCLYFPGSAFGIASSAMFQGTGKGVYALIATLLRTIILTSLLSYLFSTSLGLGLIGVWWGIIIANLVGSSVSFVWASIFVKSLKKKFIAAV